MSFQFVFDNASTFSVNNLKVVSTTITRDGTARAVSRGTPPKRFELTLPDGPRWSDISANIAAMEALDRHTVSTVKIKYSKWPWYYNYVPPAADKQYQVLCVQFPQWGIWIQDSVSWSGSFIFVENIV